MQRGDVQRLKQGAARVQALASYVNEVANKEDRFLVFEIFAGVARLSEVGRRRKKWDAMSPIDIVFGHDLLLKAEQENVMHLIEVMEPDLVTLSMPCGPWCSWMNLCDADEVELKRSEHLPLWRFARRVWDKQDKAGRLVLTEQPWLSEALNLTFMKSRPHCHRVQLDQCRFGLKDRVNGKPHRKRTALDVNDPVFANALRRGATCMHDTGEHQVIEGKVMFEGEWVNRSQLAGEWPSGLCGHIFDSAEVSLQQNGEQPHVTLCEEVDDVRRWECCAVNPGDVPEAELRKQMAELGVAADRYGYITYDGAGQQVPRRIRAAVAHLHSSLGHVSNERLVRMLLLSGAGEQILCAARNLRCQICAMVHPPKDAPQVSAQKAKYFNEMLSGDSFYVWDSKGDKYGAVHYLDALTTFHVGDACVNPSSTFAASVLRDQWYAIFGPPDVIYTDAGTEFAGTVDTLNEVMGVLHEVIPEGAKWKLRQAERHGSILKLMVMKMTKSHNLAGLDEIRMAVTSACAAKNRLVNRGGVSPMQAVTGQQALLPSSLMDQLCSGRMRFVVNQEISREEALQRAERIRVGAAEAFHWIDSHETLRRALASKSRPPKLELIQEGATVFIYDPPANRRGLARRMQDNVSWSGPGIVICVERDKEVPKRVWVRLKGRVKSVALEKVRLATPDEMVSGHFIKEAVEDLQKELTSGRARVVVDDEGAQADSSSSSSSSSDEGEAEEEEPPMEVDQETERMRLEKRLMHDVPLQIGKKKEAGEEDPHSMPFEKKQRLFENLAKQMGAPSPLQEAQVRHRLEEAAQRLRKTRQEAKGVRTSVGKLKSKEVHRRRDAMLGEQVPPAPGDMCPTRPIGLHPELRPPQTEPVTGERSHFLTIEAGKDLDEVLLQKALWSEPSTQARVQQLTDAAHEKVKEQAKSMLGGEIITGKERLEYNWNQLDGDWRLAYIQPLKKAFHVYIEHEAIAGVPLGQYVDPRYILPSRMVLTNKGGKALMEALLKARWVFGGHRDPEAGEHLTAAPTVSLVGHNLLVFLAVQKGWTIVYEDVSAAFLQGQPLAAEREIYVRLPTQYPPEVLEEVYGLWHDWTGLPPRHRSTDQRRLWATREPASMVLGVPPDPPRLGWT